MQNKVWKCTWQVSGNKQGTEHWTSTGFIENQEAWPSFETCSLTCHNFLLHGLRWISSTQRDWRTNKEGLVHLLASGCYQSGHGTFCSTYDSNRCIYTTAWLYSTTLLDCSCCVRSDEGQNTRVFGGTREIQIILLCFQISLRVYNVGTTLIYYSGASAECGSSCSLLGVTFVRAAHSNS